MLQTIEIKVTGKVQGVFFRKYTWEKAIALGLSGEVSNLPDGTVYILARGNKAQLDTFMHWCYTGSPRSVVTDVQVKPVADRIMKGFEIIR